MRAHIKCATLTLIGISSSAKLVCVRRLGFNLEFLQLLSEYKVPDSATVLHNRMGERFQEARRVPGTLCARLAPRWLHHIPGRNVRPLPFGWVIKGARGQRSLSFRPLTLAILRYVAAADNAGDFIVLPCCAAAFFAPSTGHISAPYNKIYCLYSW